MMTIETTIRNLNPRADKDYVLRIVERALDNADPDERPTVQVIRWLPVAGEETP